MFIIEVHSRLVEASRSDFKFVGEETQIQHLKHNIAAYGLAEVRSRHAFVECSAADSIK